MAKILIVLGPTAVGKTALGIELAKRYNGEIISGDSQQVYKKLDIGTAKASSEEQAQAVHHLIDVREPNETYSAFDFVTEANQAIDDIVARGKLPIIVGGTGLYLQSLIEGYHLGGQVDQDAVLAYRKELDRLSDEEVLELAKKKEITTEGNSRRRLIRYLELAKFANQAENVGSEHEFYLIGLNTDREVLYNRINQRVDLMMTAGLLEEAKWLFDHYPQAQATRGIGYKELFPYFEGQASLEECVEKLKQNTRRFAKRQLTWFRNRMQVNWFDPFEANFSEEIFKASQQFLEQK